MFLNRSKIHESSKDRDKIDFIFRFTQISGKFSETLLNLL